MRGCCSPTGWLPVARAAKPSLDLLIRWCHESGPVCLHWPWCLSKPISGKSQSVCAVGAGSHSLLQGVHPCLVTLQDKHWALQMEPGACLGAAEEAPQPGGEGNAVSGWSGAQGGMELRAALAESCPECHSHGHALLCPGWDLYNCLFKTQGVKFSVEGSLGLQTGGRCWPLAVSTVPCLSLWLSQPWGQRPKRWSSSSTHCRYFYLCFMLTLFSLIKKLLSVLDWALSLLPVLFSVFSLYSFSIFRR